MTYFVYGCNTFTQSIDLKQWWPKYTLWILVCNSI